MFLARALNHIKTSSLALPIAHAKSSWCDDGRYFNRAIVRASFVLIVAIPLSAVGDPLQHAGRAEPAHSERLRPADKTGSDSSDCDGL